MTHDVFSKFPRFVKSLTASSDRVNVEPGGDNSHLRAVRKGPEGETDFRSQGRGSFAAVWCIVLACFVAITFCRVALVNDLVDQGWFAKYPAMASEILAGTWSGERAADVSPGYLAFVAMLMGPFGLGPQGLRTIQIILLSVAALACGVAAWRKLGMAPAVAAAGALLTSRAALVNATEFEPETLILTFTSAGLAAVFFSEGWKNRVVGGCFFGLAAAFRPTILAPLSLMSLALWAGERVPRRWPRFFGLALGTILSLITFQAIAAIVIGGPAPTMNPGTVLYEGWNPSTSGYLGEAPALVKDLEASLAEPDGLHLAYRLIAGRATGSEPTPLVANVFWAGKAYAFMRFQPFSALKLAVRKMWLALHSHDAWDLATMEHKDRELSRRLVWLPFGWIVGFAVAGVILARRRPEAMALTAWFIGGWGMMVLFYVSSRQRNLLLPAVALLVGLAFSEGMKIWREGSRIVVTRTLVAAVIIAVLLSLTLSPQREDLHTWNLRFSQDEAARRLADALNRGEPTEAATWAVRGAVWLSPVASAPARQLELAVLGELAGSPRPERVFDLALVLGRLGRWQSAGDLFDRLEENGYRPWRGARTSSSLAFHRARCAIALGEPDIALDILGTKPWRKGDDRVLAMVAVLAEEQKPEVAAQAAAGLEALFDPFTVERVLAEAYAFAGRKDRAADLGQKVLDAFPELDD